MKFTPGPWKYRYEGSGDYEVYSEQGEEIGTAWSKDAHFLGVGSETDRNEANARLIAAAPDLLEACKELALAINPALEQLRLDHGDAFRMKLLKLQANGRAAIAKAEGT